MSKSFYNTINAKGPQLTQYQEAAETQETRILAYLKSKPFHWFPPHALQQILFDEMTPLTSIRRAITNLEHKGKLEKSPTANTMGPYGRHCYTWRYRP